MHFWETHRPYVAHHTQPQGGPCPPSACPIWDTQGWLNQEENPA